MTSRPGSSRKTGERLWTTLTVAPRGATAKWAAGTAVVVAAAITLWLVADRIVGRVVHENVAAVLRAQLDVTVAGLEAWFRVTGDITRAAAEDGRVVDVAAACDSPVAERSCQESEIERVLRPYVRAGGFSGFMLVGRNAQAWGASSKAVVVGRPVPEAVRVRLLAVAGREGAVFVAPFLAAPDLPRMLVAARVRSADRTVGVVAFETPIERFTGVLRMARAGQSGETYAIDRAGLLLSESRFEDALRAAGLLAAVEETAVLALPVRDPGGDTTGGYRPAQPRHELPLTKAAADAVTGHAGGSTTPYRDYRGVDVVGAWRWFEPLGVGIITEVDAEHAFATLVALRRVFLGLVTVLGLAGLGVLAASWRATRARERERRVERRLAEIGQYHIVRKLGEGGMGTVYLATHALLRRPTAIKVLRADREEPEAIVRFEREVRATSDLCHPNTISIFDYGRTDEGGFYYVMELVEGPTLERLVRDCGPLPEARVIHLLRQICGSLGEAHGRGLVHRDVKPSNVLVALRGGVADMVKVVDFGLVKSVMKETQVTEANMVIGTPEYMAPELFDAADSAGPDSDVYAVGCVGYFLLTGRPVFEGTMAELCNAHITKTPVSPSVRLGRPVDAALERVLLGCLAKRREARPANASDLAALLDVPAAVRGWTQEDAMNWWAEHGAALKSTPAPAGEEPSALRPARVRL